MCKYRYIYYSECKHFDFFLVEYCKAGYLYHLASSPAPGELTSSPVGATPAQDKSKQPRSPLSSIEGRQHAASGPEKQGGGSTGTTMDKVVGLNAVSQQTSLYILETQQHAFHGPTSLPPALSEQPRTTDGQILELGRAIEEAKAAGPPGSPIFRDFSPSDGTVKQLVAQLEATFHSVEAANLAFDAAGLEHSTTGCQPSGPPVASLVSPSNVSYSQVDAAGSDGLTSPVHLIEWPSTALSPIEHWQNAGVDATDPRKQRSENSPATPRPKKHASTTGAPTPHSTIRKAKSLGRLNGTPLQSPIKDGTSPRQAPPEVPTSPTKTLGRQSQALRLHTAQRAAERGDRSSPTKETPPKHDIWPIWRSGAKPVPPQTLRRGNKDSPTKSTVTAPTSVRDVFRVETHSPKATSPQRLSKSPTRRLADMSKVRCGTSSVSSPTDTEFVSARQTPMTLSPVESDESFVTAVEQDTPRRVLKGSTPATNHTLLVPTTSKSTVSANRAGRPKLSIKIPSVQQLKTHISRASLESRSASPASSTRTSKLPVRVRRETVSAVDSKNVDTTPTLQVAPTLVDAPTIEPASLDTQKKDAKQVLLKGVDRVHAHEEISSQEAMEEVGPEQPAEPAEPETEPSSQGEDEDDEPHGATLALLRELSLTTSQGSSASTVYIPHADDPATQEARDYQSASRKAAHSPSQEQPAVIAAEAKVEVSTRLSTSPSDSVVAPSVPSKHDPAVLLSIFKSCGSAPSKEASAESPTGLGGNRTQEDVEGNSDFPQFHFDEAFGPEPRPVSPTDTSVPTSSLFSMVKTDPAIIYNGSKPKLDDVTFPVERNRSASLWRSTSPTRARDPYQQAEDRFRTSAGAYSPRALPPNGAEDSPGQTDKPRPAEVSTDSPRSTMSTALRADAPDFILESFKRPATQRPAIPAAWMDSVAMPPPMLPPPQYRFVPLGEPLPMQTMTKSQRQAQRKRQKAMEMAAYGSMPPTYGGSAGFITMTPSFGGFGSISGLPMETFDDNVSPRTQPAEPRRENYRRTTNSGRNYWESFKNVFRGPSVVSYASIQGGAGSVTSTQDLASPKSENAAPTEHTPLRKKPSNVPIFRREQSFDGNRIPPAALPTAAPGSPPKVSHPPVIGQFDRGPPWSRQESSKKYVGYGITVPPCGCYDVEMAAEWIGGMCHKCWPNGI
ncbi:hypothetical protein H2201_003478 [Coniosporium apollinis]|uniref:Uncharacterized protein n=1 Tax=Coniosporium apollinis TaxID=61459 RepID=A0ABQ9NV69_9PEZI|nr:hypothetical protein H2201_003478 [Coniosporium apollinis]